MAQGSSVQVKRQVRDTIEQGFDKLHQVADVVTFPLAPLDGAVHGVARGVFNWLTDSHPGQAFPSNTAANPTTPNSGGVTQPTAPNGSYYASTGAPSFDNNGNIGSQNNTTGNRNTVDSRISGGMTFGNPRQ